MIKVGIGFTGEGLSIDRIVDFGVAAESAGLDSVWHVENQREPWVPLSVIAARTKRIRIATGFALWARSPQLAELAAVDLDELSDGRFLSGLEPPPASGTRTGTASRTTTRSSGCASTSRSSA